MARRSRTWRRDPLGMSNFLFLAWPFSATFTISVTFAVCSSLWLVALPQSLLHFRSLLSMSHSNTAMSALKFGIYTVEMANRRGLLEKWPSALPFLDATHKPPSLGFSPVSCEAPFL